MLRQLKAFDRSVNNAPKALLLSVAFKFHASLKDNFGHHNLS